MAITRITTGRSWCASIPTVIVRSTLRPRAKPVCRVPYGALVRLERSAGKLARSVLRGLGGRKPTWLPGGEKSLIYFSAFWGSIFYRSATCDSESSPMWHLLIVLPRAGPLW